MESPATPFLAFTSRVRVEVEHLVKRFGGTPALREVSLTIESRELFFLLGPSGCGKTTLLRTLAGFYQPDAGEIRFGDRAMNGVPPHERNTGMVFQNYALWPHMTVAENVGYGLDVRKVSGAGRSRKIQEALETVRMGSYAGRSPNQLSGGQQQRVALARALVIQPDLLLLDEPLSNLDARLRLEMRDEIRRIHSETRITTIYVTHDQKEALSLADRMAILRDGSIEQIGRPRDVYRQPANRFVADFIGDSNWLTGEVLAVDSQFTTIKTAAGEFIVETRSGMAPGATVQLGIRPEAIVVGHDAANQFRARITRVTYLGEIEQYELEMPDGTALKMFEQNPRELRAVGSSLDLFVRPADLLLLP